MNMIEALTKALGIVTTACKAVDISRNTHYTWYNEDAEYKKAVDDIADVALDFAESKLHQLINKEDTASTIFYMKTKGKKRGYIERTEQDLNHSGKIEIKVDTQNQKDILENL